MSFFSSKTCADRFGISLVSQSRGVSDASLDSDCFT